MQPTLSNMSHSNTRARQQGAALITSLLLLVVLTLIGVTVMQVSRMQERMAGNSRDVSTAFEAAEAALRNGEQLLRAQTRQPDTCPTVPCVFFGQGTFDSGSALGTVAGLSGSWWDQNATPYNKDAAVHTVPGVPNPSTRYLIEESSYVRTDGGIGVGIDPQAGRQFYQISARSTGASGLADVVVQTTYTRRF